MFFIFAMLACVCSIQLVQAQRPPVIPILEDVRDGPHPDGSYYFRYATGNGIFREEQSVPTGPGTFTVTGSYTYTAPNGQVIEMQYIADENGYRAFPASRGIAPVIAPLRPSQRPLLPANRPQSLNFNEQTGFKQQQTVSNLNAQIGNPIPGRKLGHPVSTQSNQNFGQNQNFNGLQQSLRTQRPQNKFQRPVPANKLFNSQRQLQQQQQSLQSQQHQSYQNQQYRSRQDIDSSFAASSFPPINRQAPNRYYNANQVY